MPIKISKEELSITLQEYRRIHNLTQEELAQKLKIPRNTIARWENMYTFISPVMFRLLKQEKIL